MSTKGLSPRRPIQPTQVLGARTKPPEVSIEEDTSEQNPEYMTGQERIEDFARRSETVEALSSNTILPYTSDFEVCIHSNGDTQSQGTNMELQDAINATVPNTAPETTAAQVENTVNLEPSNNGLDLYEVSLDSDDRSTRTRITDSFHIISQIFFALIILFVSQTPSFLSTFCPYLEYLYVSVSHSFRGSWDTGLVIVNLLAGPLNFGCDVLLESLRGERRRQILRLFLLVGCAGVYGFFVLCFLGCSWNERWTIWIGSSLLGTSSGMLDSFGTAFIKTWLPIKMEWTTTFIKQVLVVVNWIVTRVYGYCSECFGTGRTAQAAAIISVNILVFIPLRLRFNLEHREDCDEEEDSSEGSETQPLLPTSVISNPAQRTTKNLLLVSVMCFATCTFYMFGAFSPEIYQRITGSHQFVVGSPLVNIIVSILGSGIPKCSKYLSLSRSVRFSDGNANLILILYIVLLFALVTINLSIVHPAFAIVVIRVVAQSQSGTLLQIFKQNFSTLSLYARSSVPTISMLLGNILSVYIFQTCFFHRSVPMIRFINFSSFLGWLLGISATTVYGGYFKRNQF